MKSARQAAMLGFPVLGCAVLPLVGGRKTPYANDRLRVREGGHKAASKDRSVILDWQERFPKCNYGIALGQVSGIWVFDIDSIELTDDLLTELGLPESEKLALDTFSVRTPKGGLHLYWRLPESGLRSWASTRYRCEVKSDGTYAVGPYSLIKLDEGGWTEYLPVPGCQDAPSEAPSGLLEWAVSPPARKERVAWDGESDPESPFSDYNQQGDVRALLEAHGWALVERTSGAAVEHWTRPGKDRGCSGTLGYGDADVPLFYVFTSSTRLEQGRAYTPSGLLIQLEFDGNASACASHLREAGFGRDRDWRMWQFLAERAEAK